MSQKPNIAIVILAAGESSRMGTPKQLLKWENTTLLGHTIETAKALCQTKTIVILGANAERIKPDIKHYQVEVLKNKEWRFGLGNSIAFGVNYILENGSNIDGVLIMLADQPLIDQTYLDTLISAFKAGKQQIIASKYKNQKQGVPVLFDATYFQELTQLNDDKGAKTILQKYSEKVSVINAEKLVSDIDTLEDYERLYKAKH